MNIDDLTALAQKLLDLPVGEASPVVDTGSWRFAVHRYRDGWYCLWDPETIDQFKKDMGRDIGRVFRDPIDLVNFILGDPSHQFVLEAQDL